jgi:hypothetical protein
MLIALHFYRSGWNFAGLSFLITYGLMKVSPLDSAFDESKGNVPNKPVVALVFRR